ncbi:aquaporin AQPAe.a-like [Aricia agestis]|uniref:aquaporin AQPAe.a-like n=1 Tax=Aricia agestis TaxID=91739 RepID=UPI001C206EEE|nr:aquaporin AQPAe.a-like [Aricia agestis]
MTVSQDPVVSVVEIVNDKKEVQQSRCLSLNVNKHWDAVLAEFVSTMLLLFLGCMSCVPLTGMDVHPPMLPPVAFGLAVLFNISAFGHISGAHMNPSVTLSAILFGSMSIPLGVAYVMAQVLGAIAGYGLLVVVSPLDLAPDSICVTQPHPDQLLYQALLTETILSAALGFINCAVWDPANASKNDAVPLRYGFTITALSLAGGLLTGTGINPARSLAPAIFTGNWNAHWVYWVGPFLGGALAPIFYRIFWLKPSDKHTA